MKGSINIPFATVINEDGTLKSEEDLKALFASQGVDLSKTTVNTCGSGMTAAIVDLAMSTCGHEGAQFYDASWSEYG